MDNSINIDSSHQKVHEFLKTLMKQGKTLEMFFNVKPNGVQTFRIRAKGIPPFDYPLSLSGFNWVMNYINGEGYDDKDVDIQNPLHTDGETLDYLQKSNLKFILDSVVLFDGFIQQNNKIKDEKGRFVFYLDFPLGIIRFFLIPDDDIIEYMKSKGMRTE